jgi:hypothetical protein
VKTMKRLQRYGVLVIAGTYIFLSSCKNDTSASVDHERHVCFAQEDRDQAKYGLDTFSKTLNHEPDLTRHNEGEVVRYTFLDAWWKEQYNPPLPLAIHRIADFDACIQGYARHIEFYSEHGDRLGYAEDGHGVNILVDPRWTPGLASGR